MGSPSPTCCGRATTSWWLKRYTHAREVQADRMAEEITEDQSIGISRSGFYYLLKGRDDELLDRYAQP